MNNDDPYIILQPGYSTNPTAHYQIVLKSEWYAHLNTGTHLRIVEQHETYPAALRACAYLNSAMTARAAIVDCPVCTYGEPATHTCPPEQQAKYEQLVKDWSEFRKD